MIEEDENVRQAFQLSNRAMLMQRARITWLKMAVDARPPMPEMSSDHRVETFPDILHSPVYGTYS